MIDLLVRNPLLLLFIVAAIGYLLGRVSLGGVKLGVAAVLFVGLFFGALDERLKLPEIVYLLGLVLFVYTIGLSSGPSFFSSLRRKGLRDNLLVLAVLLLATGLTAAAQLLLGLGAPLAAGIFAGSLTNTPALAGAIETIGRRAGAAATDALLAEPVVGYSVTYPVGVLGVILAIYFLQRLWKVDYKAEAGVLHELGALSEGLVNRTVRVSNPAVEGRSVGELMRGAGWDVVFARFQHDGHVDITTSDTTLHSGDLVTIVGAPEDVDRAVAAIGEPTPLALDLDRQTIDYRRMFVSNRALVGRPLRELDLPRRHGAIITRVRRGDSDLLPRGGMALQLGDRVRVVARRDNIEALGRYFGDSYRELSEIDVVSLGLGIALGLLLGMVPIPLPGGGSFTLGFAGGPLFAALLLGWRERTGPVIWSLPYSANLTLRQVGLTLFLAGVGTRSGYSFVQTIAQGGGLQIFLAGALVTCISAVTLLVVGHRLLKIPMTLLIGMLAGMHTQPAALAFANEQTGDELPNLGYAAVFPTATIVKILCAQLLLALPG
jgi:putative transport protein